MGQVHQFPRAASGVARFIAEHTGTAWAEGTAVKYRHTLAGRLGPGSSSPP